MLNNDSIKIAYLHKNQKVWFIRASSGRYAKNFKYGGMIAIKHLEEALGSKLGDSLPSEEEIRAALLQNPKYYEFIEDNKTKKDKKTLNRQGNILLGQIRRFANDIEAGDIIVTKNEDNGYDIGVCAESQAYIDHTPVELPKPNDDAPKGPVLRYKLRKKVVWGPSIKGHNLPHSVRRATRGQQTITSLSEHKVKIFHLIYPFFTDGENLYFSNKIRKQGDINALVVGKLFENVSLAGKVIEALVSQGELDINGLIRQLNNGLFSDDEFVACQAEFMSPGDMWCKIPLSQAMELVPQLSAGVLACVLLTGQAEAVQLADVGDVSSNATAVIKVNEQSPTADIFSEKFRPATRAKAFGRLAEKLQDKSVELNKFEEKRATKEIRENLKLEMTSADTSKLEKFKYGINIIELRGLNEAD
jgi:hypothetical protein